MFYIVLDNINSNTQGFVITKRPDISAPVPNYQSWEVPMRDGSLYERLGTYDDIEITIECNYITEPTNWHTEWRKIKKYFLTTRQKLQFSDDLDYYYRIKKIELGTSEREFSQSGEFEVTVTVAPYEYLTDGLNAKTIDQVLNNPYALSYPTYTITGEGVCTLTVNGYAAELNIGQNLTINTDLQISYKSDLENQPNIDIDYSKLVLIEGTNTISVSEGFTLSIVPNWREL